MGDLLPLTICEQDNNSHFFLCHCKTAVALKKHLLIRDHSGRNLFFRHMFNVQLSDIPEKFKIGYQTKDVDCLKCGEDLGTQSVRPPRPPYTEPSTVYRVRWNDLLEWDGNKLIEQPPPYAVPVEEDTPATVVDFQDEPADVIDKQDSIEIEADEEGKDSTYVLYECGMLGLREEEPDELMLGILGKKKPDDDDALFYDFGSQCGLNTDP